MQRAFLSYRIFDVSDAHFLLLQVLRAFAWRCHCNWNGLGCRKHSRPRRAHPKKASRRISESLKRLLFDPVPFGNFRSCSHCSFVGVMFVSARTSRGSFQQTCQLQLAVFGDDVSRPALLARIETDLEFQFGAHIALQSRDWRIRHDSNM
jgi:hypothetical protein